MIDSRSLFEETTVEFNIPFSDNAIQFISVDKWDGQALKLDIPFFQTLLKNYFRVLTNEEIRRDKKLMKKIIEVNTHLRECTDFGVIFILWENNYGGNVYIGQAGNITEQIEWDRMGSEDWNTLREILIFSRKDQLSLSLRTAVEAKILKNAQGNKKFHLLNDPSDSEEKIKLAEFQLRDLDVRIFYKHIKTVLNCLGVKLI